MSSDFYNPEVFGLLAAYAVRPGPFVAGTSDLVIRPFRQSTLPETAAFISRQLGLQNIRSVAVKRPEARDPSGPPDYYMDEESAFMEAEMWAQRYLRKFPDLQPVDLLSICSGYEYQCTDTWDFHVTAAGQQIRNIREHLITQLPGYETTPKNWACHVKGAHSEHLHDLMDSIPAFELPPRLTFQTAGEEDVPAILCNSQVFGVLAAYAAINMTSDGYQRDVAIVRSWRKGTRAEIAALIACHLALQNVRSIAAKCPEVRDRVAFPSCYIDEDSVLDEAERWAGIFLWRFPELQPVDLLSICSYYENQCRDTWDYRRTDVAHQILFICEHLIAQLEGYETAPSNWLDPSKRKISEAVN
ncbi:MAG: hypothetical protein ACLPXB_07550 [Thiobacillaceae bacterium]